MTAPSPRATFWRGFLNALPFLLVVGPFGLVFGVVAAEAGLDLLAAGAMSVLVIAGAAQFTALQLLVDQAPVAIAVLTALAVNLRTAMYSAALVPHLGAAPLRVRAFAAYLLVDQTFAASLAEFERRPGMTLSEKLAFYFGSATPVVPVWIGASLAGAVLGRGLPPEYALDFAVPIAFLAILSPMVRSIAHLVAAAVSVGVALAFAWVPYGGALLIAGLVAMVAGAEVERRMEARRP
ncbi:MAG: AzlC family ABC transporter permease [Rhodobacteraceae bacterium]|jgi:4-azaleucine resistance transporter AzlC|nr:AzlC family ABC transporter permease [Paracoccaceae bacterium]